MTFLIAWTDPDGNTGYSNIHADTVLDAVRAFRLMFGYAFKTEYVWEQTA